MIVALLGALGLLGTTYILCAKEDMLTDAEVQASYVVIFLLLGMLFTTVLPATCITSEKESQTWLLLLTTAISDWEIVWGKFLGIVRRCLPAWLFLLGHVTLFALAGIIHPIGAVQLGILVAWVVFFLSGTGLYFSTRFRHTTTAVIANVALAAGVWAVFPLVLGIGLAIAAVGEDMLGVYMDMNPVVHAVVITDATSRSGGLASYNWIQGGIADVGEATGWILLNFVLYVVVGLAFIARAGARIRRNPLCDVWHRSHCEMSPRSLTTSVTAVRNLSLEVRDGELMVLVGPSGCGKTTTLALIAGLEHPTSGEIRIADRVVTTLSPRQRDVAMVFQDGALYPHMSVHDNLAFALRMRGLARAGGGTPRQDSGGDAWHHRPDESQTCGPVGRAAAARGPGPGDRARAGRLPPG